MASVTIKIGEVFVMADIFYGPENKSWRKLSASVLYNNMIRDDAPRAYIALERAEIIHVNLESYQAFQKDRVITWENGDVESADLPKALFNGDIRRAEVAA